MTQGHRTHPPAPQVLLHLADQPNPLALKLSPNLQRRVDPRYPVGRKFRLKRTAHNLCDASYIFHFFSSGPSIILSNSFVILSVAKDLAFLP
jgi:hypothetical protein